MLTTVSRDRLRSQFNRVGTEIIFLIVFIFFSFLISYRNIHSSGPLWVDASQYANAAAMIHDCIVSGNVFHPYSFAKENYYQYPAFHLPYHPPAYPTLLGIFFVITGVGYLSARFFVTLCLVVAACFFYAILRERGLGKTSSFCGGLLLIVTPEIARWSGDSMSEIPALGLIICASYFFLRWLKSGRLSSYLIMLSVAEAAFLSRYLVAGVFLGWFIWLLLFGKWRLSLTRAVVASSLVFIGVNVCWILFTLKFSKFETPLAGTMPNTNYVPMFSLNPLWYDLRMTPAMVGWPLLIGAALSVIYLIYSGRFRSLAFWLSWLVCYSFLLIVVGIYHEPRYFIFAIPVFPGLVAQFFELEIFKKHQRALLMVMVAIALVSSVYQIRRFPHGVVGYEAIGRELAGVQAPGNVLVAVAEHADLIFRFRSYSQQSNRVFIRADRTLSIRPPAYSDAKTLKIANNTQDVMDIIRRGRIRYVVTCVPTNQGRDDRSEEMITLDKIARSNPQDFTLVRSFPLIREYTKPGSSWQVFLWQYMGELPPTPSELPVVIPTADMEIPPPATR